LWGEKKTIPPKSFFPWGGGKGGKPSLLEKRGFGGVFSRGGKTHKGGRTLFPPRFLPPPKKKGEGKLFLWGGWKLKGKLLGGGGGETSFQKAPPPHCGKKNGEIPFWGGCFGPKHNTGKDCCGGGGGEIFCFPQKNTLFFFLGVGGVGVWLGGFVFGLGFCLGGWVGGVCFPPGGGGFPFFFFFYGVPPPKRGKNPTEAPSSWDLPFSRNTARFSPRMYLFSFLL